MLKELEEACDVIDVAEKKAQNKQHKELYDYLRKSRLALEDAIWAMEDNKIELVR